LIAKKSKETGLNTFGLMFYNNLLSVPALVLLVYGTEANVLLAYEHWADPGFHVTYDGISFNFFSWCFGDLLYRLFC
jgi:hypothetical protein